MLAFVVFQRKGFNSGWRAAGWIKSTFPIFLQKRTFPTIVILGAANGLLPCGLVYIAGTASAATGHLTNAALYMFVFGLGTLPMLFGMSLFGAAFSRHLHRFHFNRLVPVAVGLVALSLILRGLALGIPYLSPAIAEGSVVCSACVQR
jgi:sulfite exporter TauE/SafE